MTEARTPDELDEDLLPPLENDPELDGPPDEFDSEDDGLSPGASEPSTTGAAGGVVVVRNTSVGARIAVMESGGVVSLPKAEVGEGMAIETAARDAALAFTGLQVRLEEAIGETDEWIGASLVTTWFWLARPTRTIVGDATPTAAAGFTLHWLDVEEALTALSSDAERSVVERIRYRALTGSPRRIASPDSVALAADLAAFRDRSSADWRSAVDPDQLEALMIARDELERAEERLDRGDSAGARRAKARAERATFGILDANSRLIALRRELDRAPERLRPALEATIPVDGGVSTELLGAVHSAVEAARQEDEREHAASRAAQTQVTIALGATALAVLGGAFFGLFRTVPRPVLSPAMASGVFLISGALGGWVGEALFSLRGRAQRTLSLPLAAAAGALAGLVLGAFLSGGLGDTLLEDAALTLSATFAAGWLVRTFLPRS